MSKETKKTFVIFHDYIPKVGGIESAVFNLAKVLSPHLDVIIAYNGAESADTLFKYAEVADVVKVTSEPIVCDTCLIASNHAQPVQIKANKYLQWIHSDYEKYKLKLKPNNIHTYVSVSAHAGRIAKKLFDIDPVTIQNIIDPDFTIPDYKKVLRLVTNSRISPEKGFERMHKFAEGLIENKIPFQWLVYGDNSHSREYENRIKDGFKDIEQIMFVGFRQDITYGLAWADYLLQLSDFEGCPYAVLEALKVGVPCILTDFPSASELITPGKNGYLVPMEMDKIDYKKIATKIPKNFVFEQKELVEEWLKLI